MNVVNISGKYTPHKVDKKFIIIPKYAPLYAMIKCCGPTQAPIKSPIAVPIEIIGELLSQRSHAPEIFEVLPIDLGHRKYTDPVKLTLTNYRKSYQEILAESGRSVSVEPPVKPVAPVVEDKKKEETPTVTEPAVEEPVKVEETVTENEEVSVEPVVEPTVEPVTEDEVTENVNLVEEANTDTVDVVNEDETVPEEDAQEVVESEEAEELAEEVSQNVDISGLGIEDKADEPEAHVMEMDVIPKDNTPSDPETASNNQ